MTDSLDEPPRTGVAASGFIGANLVVAILSGPVFVLLMFSVEYLEHVRQFGLSAPPIVSWPGDLAALMAAPIITLPFTIVPAVMEAFPASLAVSGLLLGLGKTVRTFRRITWWAAFGGALGLLLGPAAFGLLGPMDPDSQKMSALIGLADGAFCATLLHRRLRKRGAFLR